MAVVCPTVLASEPHEFREQVERLQPFAKRVHIDLSDGVFSPNKLIDIKHLWWPESLKVDLHLMYESVAPFTGAIIALKPHLVILHAESVGNFYNLSKPFKSAGIAVGIAILKDTPVSRIESALHDIDHVMIFSGDLGHFGGTANLGLLSKAQELRRLRKDIEIGWDGGINDQNAKRLVTAGVDVLNVGGYIQRSSDPDKAYATLETISKEA